jgi:4-hydroxythreonine-4-phosphate dehydrogenase
MESLESAVRDAREGRVDAVVTGPVSKQSMNMAGRAFPGQTEYLAVLTQAREWAMMLAHGRRRVILATRHLPLRQVSSALHAADLVRLFALADRELTMLLGRRPRLLVCGVNPHAGDGGLLGEEELLCIGPAVLEAAGRGCDISGPVSAEEAFLRWGSDADAVVAMYHDQGALPVKLLGLADAVNVTLGLPIVRTSPGHGTAFSLAGTGRASERSVLAAMRWAVALARRRGT